MANIFIKVSSDSFFLNWGRDEHNSRERSAILLPELQPWYVKWQM